MTSQCVPFVILFTARTGSSHLTQSLNSHPQIRAQGEGLGRLRREGATGATQLAWAREALEADPTLSAVGFKAKPDQPLDASAFAALLCDIRPRIVHLARRNTLKQAVSIVRVSRLQALEGRSNRRRSREGEASFLPPFRIDPGELTGAIDYLETQRGELARLLERLRLPTLNAFYEDLLADERRAFARVLDFLGVPHMTLGSRVAKGTPDDLTAAVPNLEELTEALRGTPYERILSNGQTAGIAEPGT